MDGPFLFVSGQGPIDPSTDDFVTQSFEQHVNRTLENPRVIVADAGCRLEDAVKVTLYLRDMGSFSVMNSIYESFFEPPRPARTTVQSNLVGFDIEIDAIVRLGPSDWEV